MQWRRWIQFVWGGVGIKLHLFQINCIYSKQELDWCSKLFSTQCQIRHRQRVFSPSSKSSTYKCGNSKDFSSFAFQTSICKKEPPIPLFISLSSFQEVCQESKIMDATNGNLEDGVDKMIRSQTCSECHFKLPLLFQHATALLCTTAILLFPHAPPLLCQFKLLLLFPHSPLHYCANFNFSAQSSQ